MSAGARISTAAARLSWVSVSGTSSRARCRVRSRESISPSTGWSLRSATRQISTLPTTPARCVSRTEGLDTCDRPSQHPGCFSFKSGPRRNALDGLGHEGGGVRNEPEAREVVDVQRDPSARGLDHVDSENIEAEHFPHPVGDVVQLRCEGDQPLGAGAVGMEGGVLSHGKVAAPRAVQLDIDTGVGDVGLRQEEPVGNWIDLKVAKLAAMSDPVDAAARAAVARLDHKRILVVGHLLQKVGGRDEIRHRKGDAVSARVCRANSFVTYEAYGASIVDGGDAGGGSALEEADARPVGDGLQHVRLVCTVAVARQLG